MDNVNDNIVIKSNNRYKGAPEVSYQVPTTLEQNTSLLIETDRSFNLNLSDLFDQERQKSTIFRPTFKVDFLFENNYSGTTDYNPFSYNLYILDGEKSLAQKIVGTTVTWYGIPQTYEFDLIRLDRYNTHIDYRAESATTYNWDYYLTYPFSADTNFNMRWYQNDNGNLLANFLSSEGIPALLSGVTINGANYLQFTCPVKHGLSVGEYVKFPFSYNGTSFFEVNLLGNETYGSDEYVFNLYNPGYTGTTFKSGYVYIFKRTIDITNTADTTSRYYIRMNKVVSKTTDLQIETAAFDANAFNNPTKYEFSSLTPNNISSVSRLTNSQAYSITNQKDLNISGVVDENQRPIDFLYLTFVYKGYAGWFMNEKYGLKRGWEFNMNEPIISPWWDFNQPLSNETSITKTSYSKAQLTKIYNFYYNETLNTGDTIYGDWYEYNDYEQLGRVISPYYHKFVFNQKNFNIGVGNTNPTGYYYQVHHPMRIKSYSGYIEEGEPQSVLDIPTYSYFSQNLNMFRWRDLYPYGYIDVDGNGVDYPFVNQTQYPYTNIQFRLIPEGAKLGLTQSTFIPRPLVDECE